MTTQRSYSSPCDLRPEEFRNIRKAHWDAVARNRPGKARLLQRTYYRRINHIHRFLVPPGSRVLEIGCGEGELLAALEPSVGVGVDFSGGMLALATKRFPNLTFVEEDVHQLGDRALPEAFDVPFDTIVLSGLVNDLWDINEALVRLRRFCSPDTRIILNYYSHLYEHAFRFMEGRGWVTPRLEQNWVTPDDMAGILHLAGYEVVRSFDEFLWPFETPFVEPLLNRWLVKLWPFSMGALTHFQVCRAHFETRRSASVSVIIPARNEAGNIEDAVRRTPEMGLGTEIIFVEGHSSDETWDVIERCAARHPQRCIKALRQPGKGKGDAVRAGFDAATGDILMILDADLTVPPETLPQFYEAIASGKAEFVNGVRLVYPQDVQAMRFWNIIGNKFFSLAFSWLLGRSIKDTLCGTKVLGREHYRRLAANRAYFGEFDPSGDFDLLFGAAKLNLRLIDLPVRYRERTYGQTNISRWRDGCILLRMVLFAARRIKFV